MQRNHPDFKEQCGLNLIGLYGYMFTDSTSYSGKKAVSPSFQIFNYILL